MDIVSVSARRSAAPKQDKRTRRGCRLCLRRIGDWFEVTATFLPALGLEERKRSIVLCPRCVRAISALSRTLGVQPERKGGVTQQRSNGVGAEA